MSESNAITKNVVKKLISTHFNTEVRKVQEVETGLFNETYFITLKDTLKDIVSCRDQISNNGNEVVLRIAPDKDVGLLFYEKNMMAQEPEIHSIVKNKTTIPIPQIYLFDDSGSTIPRSYLVMEKMSGSAMSQANWVNRALRIKILRQIGEYLSELHNITRDKYGYLGSHRPMNPQPTWWDAFKVMWGKLIDDVQNCGVYNKRENRKYKNILESASDHFSPRNNVPASLLHMDVWEQNILINKEGDVTALLDWDRALWGDPEIEYAVLKYCGISERAFWNGYGKVRNETRSSKIRDLFYFLYEHQKYMPIYTWRRQNANIVTRYKQNCVSAFKTIKSLL